MERRSASLPRPSLPWCHFQGALLVYVIALHQPARRLASAFAILSGLILAERRTLLRQGLLRQVCALQLRGFSRHRFC